MSESSRPVRVRFAPSPTGYLHIGGLRTALYNWLFARHYKGTFILRVEDTDRARFVEGAIENLYSSLEDCGVTPDEGIMVKDGVITSQGEYGPYLQSERKDKHLAYAQALIQKGHAYYCFCSAERLEQAAEQQRLLKQAIMYDRHCRNLPPEESEARAKAGESHVVRFKVPTEGSIVVHDLIRGSIEIPWAQVDDQVLIKSDGFPTYHLAATCDDHDMDISHVIRGEEWISSLPKHIYLAECMGWEAPKYAHLPLLLNADRSKLSKRQGDVATKDYLDKGYLPEALINFVALLGWNPSGEQEIYTKEALADLFDITKVNKSGAVFNTEKLNWLNAHYIKQLSQAQLKDLVTTKAKQEGVTLNLDRAEKAAKLAAERATTTVELWEKTKELCQELSDYDGAHLVWSKSSVETAKERLNFFVDWITNQQDEMFSQVSDIDEKVRSMIVEKGWQNGDTLWPLRVALSGQEKSPSPFELMWMLGKDESLKRVKLALEKVK